MIRQEILEKVLNTFYKKLPIFLDTLTPIQLERLELDLYRHFYSDEAPIHIVLTGQAGRRNCGDEYFTQGD